MNDDRPRRERPALRVELRCTVSDAERRLRLGRALNILDAAAEPEVDGVRSKGRDATSSDQAQVDS